METEKPVYWVGTSYKDLLEFPAEARQEAGYQLHRVQNGLEPIDWKPFSSVGVRVREIRIHEQGGAFRVMYVAKFSARIYVLHAFQKKTQKTAAKDIDAVRTRYRAIANQEQP